MFAYALASKPCSEATNIGSILSLGADFGWGCLFCHPKIYRKEIYDESEK